MQNKGSRPIKFTHAVMEDVLSGVAKGFTLKAACRFAGVSYSTLANWMFKGKQSKKSNIRNKYTDVLERIDHARYIQTMKHRDQVLLTLRPRDFRFGWENPMQLQTRKKISAFWRKN
jgi:lambda repressor-like predicted transcriptional regulator